MGWIIAIIALLIFPILMLRATSGLPEYCMIAYYVWMILSTVVVAYTPKRKIIERLIVPIVLTIAFLVVLCIGQNEFNAKYSLDNMDAGTVLAYLLGALLCIPLTFAIGFLWGESVSAKMDLKTQEKIDACKKMLDSSVANKEAALKLIAQFEIDSSASLNLISFVENMCPKNDYGIKTAFVQKENERFCEYHKEIFQRIPDSEKNDFPAEYSSVSSYVANLKREIKDLKDIQYEINTYSDKQLKNLEKHLKQTD